MLRFIYINQCCFKPSWENICQNTDAGYGLLIGTKRDDTWDHVDVHSPCFGRGPCLGQWSYCRWSRIMSKAMWMSVVCSTAWTHVYVHGLSYHQGHIDVSDMKSPTWVMLMSLSQAYNFADHGSCCPLKALMVSVAYVMSEGHAEVLI